MVKGFAHCALYTPKARQAVRFYMDVFDAEDLGEFQASSKGRWLRLGKDILEIFESEELGTGCFRHIAVACSDVDALYNRAISRGAEPMIEPKDAVLSLKEPVKARLAFVRGVAGEEIELFCIKED